MHEVLALEPELAAGELGQALGEVQRRRAAGEVAQQAVELAEVAGVRAHADPGRLELVERGQQRLGHVLAAVGTEAVLDAGFHEGRAVAHGADPAAGAALAAAGSPDATPSAAGASSALRTAS